eukprot:jgi/Botrbrau1/2747/Bobra.0164s0027.1
MNNSGNLENNTTRRVDARVCCLHTSSLLTPISSQLQTPKCPSYVLPLPKDKRAISSIPLAVPKQNVDKSPTRHLRGEYVALPQKQHSIQAAGQAGHAQISAAYPSRQSGEGDSDGQRSQCTKPTESILRPIQNLQESLTDQLVPMAAALKRNAQAMEQAVSERGTLLDESETVLDGNVAAAGRAVRESKVVYATNKRGFCWTLTVLFFTGLTFIGVYLFIKATRLAGYKRFVPVRTTGLHEEL